MNDPVALVILDGFGLRSEQKGNAIALADTPLLDHLFSEYPWSRLKAAGEYVGLPEGQIGNSEVGHMNLGAGRIVYQPLTRINKSIENDDFYQKEVLSSAIEEVRESNNELHLVGLLSDGGVHSHQKHLRALLQLCKRHSMENVYVHPFLDGRDVPPRSAASYLEELLRNFEEIGIGKIATMGGRYYGMDRDDRWDRIEKAYRAMVEGKAEVYESDPIEALENAYEKRDENDEFVTPTVFTDNDGNPVTSIDPEDGIIFFNFRPDRARQLTRSLTSSGFDHFDTPFQIENFVCMTQYDKNFDLPVAFSPIDLKNVLTEYISNQNASQFHLAETEKYAHVTFFLNGGREEPFPEEERKLIPSPKVDTYDERPKMSALKIKNHFLRRIQKENDDFYAVNFANPDMVGHTGDLEATIHAMEVIDECMEEVLEECLKRDCHLFLTADHGNAEMMINPKTGDNHTAHTKNDVPLLYVGQRQVELQNGQLADVAPTILEVMNLPKPEKMSGDSLLPNKKTMK